VGTEVPATATSAVAGGQDAIDSGYHLLLRWLILPVQPSALLDGAWRGVQSQARQEGVANVPVLPPLSTDADADLATFHDAYSALLASHGGLDDTRLAQAALTSMAEAVNDCHTAYVTAGQWASIQDDLAGEDQLPSLPVTFQLAPPYLVETVVAGSDADRQGIRPGDSIVSFDGVSLDAVPLSRRKFLTLGAQGSTAQLVVQTPDGQRRTATLTRTSVDQPLITTQIHGSVGYIGIRTFSENLNQQLDQAFSSLQSQGARGYVIDLRGNLGGYLEPAIALLSKFIPSGLLATDMEGGGRTDSYSADGSVLPGPPPLAVLIDGGSLSASEEVAEAIRLYGAGELVGTPAPGCLEGSGFFDMPDGASMQITAETVAVGPQQADINTSGVQPDVEVPLTAADLASGQDPQLDRAVADVAAQLGG
jgi:carboxyl-terminal processing protease